MAEFNPYVHIVRPVMTERSTILKEKFNQYVFEVSRESAKGDVKRAIEELLRKFSYQAIGHSVVKISGLDWLQYPVQSGSGAERITGMVRFTSAGGRVFSITALRGGGQEAAA